MKINSHLHIISTFTDTTAKTQHRHVCNGKIFKSCQQSVTKS